MTQTLLSTELLIVDPGAVAPINITQFGTLIELVSGSGDDENRRLSDPAEAGIIAFIRMSDNGGADIIVTGDSAIDDNGNDIATFAEEGQILCLISIPTATAFRWQVFANFGPLNTGAEGLVGPLLTVAV